MCKQVELNFCKYFKLILCLMTIKNNAGMTILVSEYFLEKQKFLDTRGNSRKGTIKVQVLGVYHIKLSLILQSLDMSGIIFFISSVGKQFGLPIS